jgi:hypothetical protein
LLLQQPLWLPASCVLSQEKGLTQLFNQNKNCGASVCELLVLEKLLLDQLF